MYKQQRASLVALRSFPLSFPLPVSHSRSLTSCFSTCPYFDVALTACTESPCRCPALANAGCSSFLVPTGKVIRLRLTKWSKYGALLVIAMQLDAIRSFQE